MAGEKPAIDQSFEAGRPELKRQAQEWAGLEQNPNAELFVFVGRWSLQKGVDLIADIFPWVLEQYPQTQLIVSLITDTQSFRIARLTHISSALVP